jgi:hypothetical protein
MGNDIPKATSECMTKASGGDVSIEKTGIKERSLSDKSRWLLDQQECLQVDSFDYLEFLPLCSAYKFFRGTFCLRVEVSIKIKTEESDICPLSYIYILVARGEGKQAKTADQGGGERDIYTFVPPAKYSRNCLVLRN